MNPTFLLLLCAVYSVTALVELPSGPFAIQGKPYNITWFVQRYFWRGALRSRLIRTGVDGQRTTVSHGCTSMNVTEYNVSCYADSSSSSVRPDRGSVSLLINNVDISDDGSTWRLDGPRLPFYESSILYVFAHPDTTPTLSGGWNGQEGESSSVTCRVGRAKPPANLTWSDECGESRTSYRVISVVNGTGLAESVLTVYLNRVMHGRRCTCRADHPITGWITESSRLWNVDYPSETAIAGDQIVSEGQTLRLACQPGELSLDNYTLTWSDWYNDHLIQELQAGPEIRVVGVTFQDQGEYRCTMEDKFGEGTKTNVAKIQIEAVPKFPNQRITNTVVTGNGAVLRIGFVSYPRSTRVTWAKLGQNQPPPKEQRIVDKNQTFTFHGVSVTVPGKEAQLMIPAVQLEDSGNYVVHITNDMGTSEYRVFLKVIDYHGNEMDERGVSLEARDSPSSSAMFVAGFFVSIGLVVLAGVVAVLVLRRKGFSYKFNTGDEGANQTVELDHRDQGHMDPYEDLQTADTIPESGDSYEALQIRDQNSTYENVEPTFNSQA